MLRRRGRDCGEGGVGVFLLYKKRNVTKQKFHRRKKGSEKEIAFMQQLCCSVLQRCWHDYRSVRRIKEAALQMTAALAKSYCFIAFASGNSDSSAKALYLSGGRLKENLSCRLRTVNASAFFACGVWCLPERLHTFIHLITGTT